MIRTPVFVANWKMNHGPREARMFVERFLSLYHPHGDRTVILCPPALSLDTVASALSARPDVACGIQNIWTEPKGAFTGESSAPMAREAGARYVLVGHSERRHVFGETNAQTAAKCAVAVASDLVPILCVGETLDQRERGEAARVVVEQLREGTAMLTPGHIASMLVAYEPVWAIGTGKTATAADASVIHATMRATLADIVHGAADAIPILYGGSVSTANASGLLQGNDIDGLLVGGASLDANTWATICDSAAS